MVPQENSDHVWRETEADEIRPDDVREPSSADGANVDPGTATEADRIGSADLDQNADVAGLSNLDPGTATEAERIGAADLDQNADVAGLSNLDPGTATEGERIGAAGLHQPGSATDTEHERRRPLPASADPDEHGV